MYAGEAAPIIAPDLSTGDVGDTGCIIAEPNSLRVSNNRTTAPQSNAGAAGLPDLWVTRNGGITWTSLLMNEVDQPAGSTPSVDIGGLGLDFLTTQVGWAAPTMISSEEVPSAYDLMVTTDGGRQWASVHVQVSGPAP